MADSLLLVRLFIPFGVVAAGGLMIMSGCGSSKFAAAEGVVTLDGDPLSNATVIFQSPDRPLATAKTDSYGQYRLETGSIDGVRPGDYVVTIAAYKTGTNGEDRVPHLAIPKRYVLPESSGLKATITDGANRSIDFDLKTRSPVPDESR